jgi:methionine-rich copper-binding protein CopC
LLNKKLLAVATILLATLFNAATGTPARAHTELIDAEPPSESVLESTPKKVTLTFGDEILVLEGLEGSNQIVVTNSRMVEAQEGPVVVRGSQISVKLKPNLDSGIYRVAYRVVSLDGHPIEGVYSFELDLGTPYQETDGSVGLAPQQQTAPIALNPDKDASEGKTKADNFADSITHWVIWASGTLVFLAVMTVTVIKLRRKV